MKHKIGLYISRSSWRSKHTILVDLSPWPLVGACGAFFTTVGGVMYFHYSQSRLLVLGLILIIGTMIVWWRDVIREGTYQGCHTFIV